MLIVRGVNVYPSALEAIVREFPEVAEFRITVTRVGALDELALEVETAADGCAARVALALHARLNLRVVVQAVSPGTLPRWELKARRVVDRRS
jgi:phenylacetate-CoA ligase